jgi:hypothetical protein
LRRRNCWTLESTIDFRESSDHSFAAVQDKTPPRTPLRLSESRFTCYVDGLVSVIGTRIALILCTTIAWLMLPGERKSVVLMAAIALVQPTAIIDAVHSQCRIVSANRRCARS